MLESDILAASVLGIKTRIGPIDQPPATLFYALTAWGRHLGLMLANVHTRLVSVR